MKHTAGLLLTAIFLTIVISSCSSLGKSESANLIDPASSGDISEQKALPEGWRYETEITHEGSRSEGSISRLFYRYNEIPSVFTRLIIGTAAFEYKAIKNIWDDSGYIRDTSGKSFKPDETGSISPDEMKRGWYFSNSDTIKKGTPSSWIWAEGGGQDVRIAPGKISDFISLYDLQIISSSPELMLNAD